MKITDNNAIFWLIPMSTRMVGAYVRFIERDHLTGKKQEAVMRNEETEESIFFFWMGGGGCGARSKKWAAFEEMLVNRLYGSHGGGLLPSRQTSARIVGKCWFLMRFKDDSGSWTEFGWGSSKSLRPLNAVTPIIFGARSFRFFYAWNLKWGNLLCSVRGQPLIFRMCNLNILNWWLSLWVQLKISRGDSIRLKKVCWFWKHKTSFGVL